MKQSILLRTVLVVALVLPCLVSRAEEALSKALKTEYLQNTTVSSNEDLSRLSGGRDVAGQQIDPAQLQKMLEELQAVKQTMEERNRLLDQMMNE
jgi:hypothetical protein